jgi:hypothetical protein
MKNNSWLVRVLVSACFCLAVGMATLGRDPSARGQDEIPPTPPNYAVRQAVIVEQRMPDSDPQQSWAISRATHALLSELGPGVMIRVTKTSPGGFFDNHCSAPTSCEAMLQHIGVNFEECNHTCDELATQFTRVGCPCTAAGDCHCPAGACRCGGECLCGSTCSAAAAAKSGQDSCAITVGHAEQLNQQPAEPVPHDQLRLLQHMASLLAEKAAARAELDTRKEASAKLIELYETIAELIAANAALEAKLEAQAEHAKLAEKLADLAAENARLKTHVEFAAGRAETSQHSISLTLENERLKLRLADLEQKHAIAEATRTAAKPRGERKPR